MFDLDHFIEDCRDAITKDRTHKSIRELVATAVADPGNVLRELGEPTRGGFRTFIKVTT